MKSKGKYLWKRFRSLSYVTVSEGAYKYCKYEKEKHGKRGNWLFILLINRIFKEDRFESMIERLKVIMKL